MDPGLARTLPVDDPVRVIDLHGRGLGFEQVGDLLHIGGIGLARRHAEIDLGERHDLAGRSHHADLALGFRRRIEQHLQGVRGLLHELRVHRKGRDPPIVRHRIFAARIPSRVLPTGLDVLVFGQLGRIDLLDQAFLGEDRHEIGRHDHDVVARRARLQLREQGLVGIVGIERDLDPGLGLEFLDDVGRRVVGPIIDEEVAAGACGACSAEQQGHGGGRGEDFRSCLRHGWFLFRVGVQAFRLRRSAMTNDRVTAAIDTSSRMVAAALASGVTPTRSMP